MKNIFSVNPLILCLFYPTLQDPLSVMVFFLLKNMLALQNRLYCIWIDLMS